MIINEIDNSLFSDSFADKWNSNEIPLDDIKMDSNLAWLLCSLITMIAWVIYITFYNARVLGYILTKILNRFYFEEGYFRIGSVSLNALSGKIMFRDIIFVTYDYTLRIQDGYLIFRWWKSYVPKDVCEDLSNLDTRVSIVLNGLEFHVYNRSKMYNQLIKTFNLNMSMYSTTDNDVADGTEIPVDNDRKQTKWKENFFVDGKRPEAAMARTWRDLIPVVEMEVFCGRFVFGNRLVPTTLSITVEESHFLYSTKPAASSLDRFMHFCKCWGENIRVMLAPSPKYTGLLDEPPRYMGEGFVLMSTNYMEMYMYMDEPGLVPNEPVLLTLANGDIVEAEPPICGVDIKCGKGTDFSYGPWADRQRDNLFKFFYPHNYRPMELTKIPKPGDKRQMQVFDIRISMLNEATIDLLFSKNKETNAIHVNIGAGSFLEISIPWVVYECGYTTKIRGQLLHLEATTSLQFRDLIASESLEIVVDCNYPRIWNEQQHWDWSITGCKATLFLVFQHKYFFQDFFDDWTSVAHYKPNILHFLPYVWKFNVSLKQCEIITLCNDFNLVDCSSIRQKQKLENSQIGLCAYVVHLSFTLPFDQFLPETIPFHFLIQGESIDLAFFVPETYAARTILLALNKYIQINSKDNQFRQRTKNVPKWRNICTRESNWFDFWWIPIGAISINFVYHPIAPLGPEPQADISTPVKEELLLSPIRFPRQNKVVKSIPNLTEHMDPSTLTPDRVKVDLEIGPSILLVYGIVIKLLINLKENIFGEDQVLVEMKQDVPNIFSDLNKTFNSAIKISINDPKSRSQNVTNPNIIVDDRHENESVFDARNYRPLAVDASIILHDIQAHLLVGCNSSDTVPIKPNEVCPVIMIERFAFEMKKRYEESKLQLLLSPCVMFFNDNINRKGTDANLGQGRLTLSALQIRGHAMFSDKDIVWGEDTVEYAWLVEIQLGKLSGKITIAHLEQLAATINVLLLLLNNSENQLWKNTEGTRLEGGNESEKKHKQGFPINVKLFSSVNTTNAPNPNTTPIGHKKQKMVSHRKSIQEQMKKLKSSDRNVKKNQYLQQHPQQQQNSTVKGTENGTLKKISDQHSLKYKLFRLAVDVVDLWLVENGVAVQTFMSPIRIAFCNLHDKDIGLGISCLIKNIRIHQMLRTTIKNFLNGNGYQNEMVDNWLKIGAINFDSLIIESSIGTEMDEINELQYKFLRLHDEKTARLKFLWSNSANSPCGCVGGCTFFGNSSTNGLRFFKPQKSDLKDGINVAVFRIAETCGDYGFGQSILYENNRIFRTPPYNVKNIILQDSFDAKNPSEINASITKVAEVPYVKLTTHRCDFSKHESNSKITDENQFRNQKTLTESLTKNSVSDSKLVMESRNNNKTQSVSSENQSEVYFSALDDGSMNSTTVNSPSNLQSKFFSDIYLDSNCNRTSNTIDNDSSTDNTLTNSSEENPSSTSSSSSTFQSGKQYSFSNVSYQSALGSHDENATINLNGQAISDNPVLMSTYATHLSQAICLNWSKPVHFNNMNSLFNLNSETNSLQYIGGDFVPNFIRTVTGFTSLSMQSNTNDKTDLSKPNEKSTKEPSIIEESDNESSINDETKYETITKTSIIVKVIGALDIMITPLILESTQRFLDTLIPVFNNIHPLTVLNFLHNSCINQVIDANILKKNFETSCWPDIISKQKLGSTYEELFRSKMQVAVHLPKINVTLLQASLDEEVPTPTTLSENLTCTSLFSVCFLDFKVDFHHETQIRELIQVYYRPVLYNSGTKKGAGKGPMSIFAYFHNITAVNDVQAEPVCIETAEKQREDTVLSLFIGKIHSQLRRLQNDNAVLNRATITAIPVQKSKVDFTYESNSRSFYSRDFYESCEPKFIVEEANSFVNDTNYGFIMFECGLEGFSVKVIKRDEFLDTSTSTNASSENPETSNETENQPNASSDNISSCVFNLNDVWFNFAAPPQTLATTKIGYTRLDWNFLSTASPAINAWINPSNKFAMRSIYVSRVMYKRASAVVACLMAQMLDMKPFQLPSNKSRFEHYLTPLAKTLQEDPSCHLFQLLEQFILNANLSDIEENLSITNVPPLTTLRQGIIALSRQWKNILHTPLITDKSHKMKNLKPVNVMFTVPEVEDELIQQQATKTRQQTPADNNSAEDESTALLYGDAKQTSSSIFQRKFTNVSSDNKQQLYSNLVYPLLSSFSQYKNHDDTIGYDALHEEKNTALTTTVDINKSSSDLGLQTNKGTRTSVSCDDLYNWVAKQQKESKKSQTDVKFEDSEPSQFVWKTQRRRESKRNSFEAVSMFPMQDSLHLLDVHMVFKPLLFSLNVIPHQLITSKMTLEEIDSENNKKLTLDSFGANLSLIGLFNSIRIDIVISDDYYDSDMESIIDVNNKTDLNSNQDLLPAAFTCQNVRVDLNLKKLVDMTVSDIIRSRHVLYISNSQIKKHTSLSLNFSVYVQQITQQVNMPLLRLLKQICNMYQNVKEKQNELFRENHPLKTTPIIKTSSTSSEMVNLRNDPSLSRAHLRNRNLLAGYHSLIETSTYNRHNSLTEESTSEVIRKERDNKRQCWKTIYNLLDLYATMPETKRITHRFSFSDFPDLSKKYTSSSCNDQKPQTINDEERTKLVALGVFKIESCRFLASISGLRLNTETKKVNLSVTFKKKNHLPVNSEWSLTGHMDKASIVLLEGVAANNQQTVVEISVGKSQAMYSYLTQKSNENNNVMFVIGEVKVVIPQHPVALHGMVTRGSKHLSSTIQELRLARHRKFNSTTGTNFDEDSQSSKLLQQPQKPKRERREKSDSKRPEITFLSKVESLLSPLVIKCSVLFKSFRITAALLPSLQSEYKMEKVNCIAITGNRANLRIELPKHSLSFTTKMQKKDANLPSEAHIDLPTVKVFAEYVPESLNNNRTNYRFAANDNLLFYKGSYISAEADIGVFKHCLTTDLLNHLVFIQKVFMSEINEVIQKVYGGERPVPLWSDNSHDEDFNQQNILSNLLYSITIRMQRIQITATTASNSAIRFETGMLLFEFSNRIYNLLTKSLSSKLFGTATVDLNLFLGQLIRTSHLDDFQEFAFFKTNINIRNTVQDEVNNADKDVILITLEEPQIYIQPIAIDKAILIWLNYKNAYEYWMEKRSDLQEGNIIIWPNEKLSINDTLHSNTIFLQLTVTDMGICIPLNAPLPINSKTIFDLETKDAVVITLENTNISACSSDSLVSKGQFTNLCLRFAEDFQPSLDDWKPNISDLSLMNLCVVSDGTYEICSRTIPSKSLNDSAKWFLNVQWQMKGVDMELDTNVGRQLSVLGHTLTMLAASESSPYNKDDNFFMNMDFTFDEDQKSYNEDKRSSSSSDDFKWKKNNENDNDDDESSSSQNSRRQSPNLPEFLRDPNLDPKMRTKLLETEMSEQAKLINDLRSLGASHNTILQELKKFRELEALVYKDFRRDVLQRLRRQRTTAALANKLKATTAMADSSSPKSSFSSRTMSFKKSTNSTKFNRQMSLPISKHPERTADWLNQFDETLINLEDEDVLQETSEPNIDFELDVKVLINSGKCVLHTRDDDAKQPKSKKFDSVPTSEGSPPVLPRRPNREKLSQTMSSSRLRNLSQGGQSSDITILHIPGMEVKLHYDSKMINNEDTTTKPKSNQIFTFDTIHENTMVKKSTSTKKAALYVWMTLDSFPEETILTPHILEFLEQTLEPIPIKGHFDLNDNSSLLEEFGSNMNIYTNYAYESFPVDVIVYFHMQSSAIRFSSLPISRVECILQLPSLDIVFSSKRAVDNDDNTSSIGGLSVTACLADFSIYIFHPYGGAKKKSAPNNSQCSPSNTNERKDSLAINVEFVKVNLSRLKKRSIANNKKAGIEFSAIVDIGSASFKYDMRRLSEILAFPKAWYKRSIVRRLFLGDLSSYQSRNEDLLKSHLHNTNTKIKPKSPSINRSGKLNRKLNDIEDVKVLKQTDSWETVVLFTVNFNKLYMHINMGNVMGNTTWQTNDLRSEGRLLIGSNNRRDLNISLNISGTSFDAKGGIVGGTIEVSKINTYLKINEELNKKPEHELGLKLFTLETKFDYMATSVLMLRISRLLLTLKDEWKLNDGHTENMSLPPGTHRSANIFINSKLNWDQFQLLISKSSSIDVMKMYSKLEEFFNQQLNSSKRVFTSLRTDSISLMKKSDNFVITIEDDTDNSSDAVNFDKNEYIDTVHEDNEDTFDHHWKPILNYLEQFRTHLAASDWLLPRFNTIFGGVIELQGTNISVACFHGINFKSKSWALFSVKDPSIIFVTEAQELPTDEENSENSIHVVQTVTCNLGTSYDKQVQQQSMAIVCRVSRNVIFPPQFKNIHEWFSYAFSTSPIDEIERFPSFELERLDKNRISNAKQLQQSFSFNREVIFALPSLQLDFKTEHFQHHSTNVECSFVTQFDDHIFVTVDAEAFFFLHDLITSYIREKDKVNSFKIETHNAESLGEAANNTVSDSQKITSLDNRNFACKTWHLEPTVRLLSWAGKSIEPYGIDYILQKLGFTHARITIPKWMQRGLMDPLDQSLALLTLRMLAIVKGNSQKRLTN